MFCCNNLPPDRISRQWTCALIHRNLQQHKYTHLREKEQKHQVKRSQSAMLLKILNFGCAMLDCSAGNSNMGLTEHRNTKIPSSQIHRRHRRPGERQRIVSLDAAETRGSVVASDHVQQTIPLTSACERSDVVTTKLRQIVSLSLSSSLTLGARVFNTDPSSSVLCPLSLQGSICWLED